MAAFRREAITTADGRIGGVLHHPAVANHAAPLLVCVHGGGCNGRYFDLRGASLVATAADRGVPVLLIDRPGHGVSAPPPPGSPIAHGAAATRALVAALRAGRDELGARRVAMIGHSIGAAVALTYAAQAADDPLAALCVSGIGDRPTPALVAFARMQTGGASIDPPTEWFFGPDGSYAWQGPAALRAAAEPWRPDEVSEVIDAWPSRWSDIAGAIDCPVHFRLAEFERIWDAGPAAIDRIAGAFTAAARIDAAIAPAGGHLYELHRRGPELVAAQLDFILAPAGAA